MYRNDKSHEDIKNNTKEFLVSIIFLNLTPVVSIHFEVF
jgi:hypothetical protein